jgi:hypothetical protein
MSLEAIMVCSTVESESRKSLLLLHDDACSFLEFGVQHQKFRSTNYFGIERCLRATASASQIQTFCPATVKTTIKVYQKERDARTRHHRQHYYDVQVLPIALSFHGYYYTELVAG